MKKLGMGMMRLPLLNAEDPKSIDVKQVCRMVDAFLEEHPDFSTCEVQESVKAVTKDGLAFAGAKHPDAESESYKLTLSGCVGHDVIVVVASNENGKGKG